GTPALVAQGVATDVGSGAVQFAVSTTGDALWAPGGSLASSRLLWVDRQGAETAVPLPPAPYNEIMLSPDGKRAALVGGEGGVADLWVADLERGALTRLTSGEFVTTPTWSPDGRMIAYGTRSGAQGGYRWQLVRKLADGSRDAEVLTESDRTLNPSSYTPDGKAVLYTA